MKARREDGIVTLGAFNVVDRVVTLIITLGGEAVKRRTSGGGGTDTTEEGLATGAGMGTRRGVREGVVIEATVIPVKIQKRVLMASNWSYT